MSCTTAHLQLLVGENFNSTFFYFLPNINLALSLCRNTWLDAAEKKNHEQIMPYVHRILNLHEVGTHTPIYGDTGRGKSIKKGRNGGRQEYRQILGPDTARGWEGKER